MLPKVNNQREKKTICQVLMKIEEMVDVFLNSANIVTHALLTLAPSSDYALKLKGVKS